MKYIFQDNPEFKKMFDAYEGKPHERLPEHAVFCVDNDRIVGAIELNREGQTLDKVPIYTAHWEFAKGYRSDFVLEVARMILNRVGRCILTVSIMEKVAARFRASKIMAHKLGFKVIGQTDKASILSLHWGDCHG